MELRVAFILFILIPFWAQNTFAQSKIVELTYGEPFIRFIEEPKPSIASENPILSPQFWGQAGLGYAQFRYTQTLPQFSDLSFYEDAFPSLNIQAGAWFHYHWGLEAYYKTNPGAIKSTSNVEVHNGEYRTHTIGAEILYRKNPLLLEQKSETFFKLGIHQHDFPFLAAISPILLNQQTSSIRTVSFGFETHCKINDSWRLETWLRYQYPFNSDVTPQFTMDGSIGALYRFPKHSSLGVFWTGEWHEYKYTGIFQNIYQSTFDIRMGVEF